MSVRQGKIFSKEWMINGKGQASKGYKQSLAHIRLIQEEAYKLFTFPLQPGEETWQDDVIPKIKSFTPELTQKQLVGVEASVY